MGTEDLAGLARGAVEAIWNRGDLDVADALFAPGYVNHGGLIPDLVRGPEAVKVAAALFRAAFPRLRVTVEDLLAEGDTVALRWTAHAAPPDVRAADGPDRAPPSAGGGLTGMTVGRVAGGRFAESWTSWDAGAGPPPHRVTGGAPLAAFPRRGPRSGSAPE